MAASPHLISTSAVNSVRLGVKGAPLVVLIHAVGLDLTYWDGQIAALAGRYDVVAYDLPGHGGSAVPPIGFDFAFQVTTLAALIRACDVGPAHIIGLSVGGMIAQSLVLAEPSLVRSLALIDTTATFPTPVRTALRERAALVRTGGMATVLGQTLERWFTPGFAERRPDVLDRVTKTLLACDPEVHAGMWEMIATLDLASRLPDIEKPTLVLVGEQDPTTPVAAAQAIAAGIVGAELTICPGVSHMAPIEAPQVVADRILSFLSGVA